MATRLHSRVIALTAAALLITGCQMPDLQPFADATGQLRSAVVESCAVTAQTMAAAAKMAPPKNGENHAEQFAAVWRERVALMDVLVGYSDALAGVADAAQQARQTTDALGNSLMQLADVVPVTGAAVNAGVDLGKALIRTGIQIKACHDLEQAAGTAHPALVQIADYIDADLRDLKTLYENAWITVEGALDSEYGRREYHRKQLLEKRDELRQAALAEFSDAAVEQVEKTERLLAHMEPEHRGYVTGLESLLKERSATLAMMDTARAGVRTWIKAHEDLITAIKENRQPNVRLILITAQEIRDAVERIREQ